MAFRIEAQCENNHCWSVLSDDAEHDPGQCPYCDMPRVLSTARRLPDRLFVSIEPAMFIDEYSNKQMRGKMYFVSINRDGAEHLGRTPNPMAWEDALKLVDRLRDLPVESGLKIWERKFGKSTSE